MAGYRAICVVQLPVELADGAPLGPQHAGQFLQQALHGQPQPLSVVDFPQQIDTAGKTGRRLERRHGVGLAPQRPVQGQQQFRGKPARQTVARQAQALSARAAQPSTQMAARV